MSLAIRLDFLKDIPTVMSSFYLQSDLRAIVSTIVGGSNVKSICRGLAGGKVRIIFSARVIEQDFNQC